jgi:formate hydrogenlyase subunit 3/multisubunit Na+/H+ antiporter MnhD subunit
MAVDETGTGSSKRKRAALKTLARTAGVLSSVALTTTGFPPAALAAKKTLQVVEVAKTAEDTQKLFVAGAGVVAAGIATVATITKRSSGQDFLEATPYWDQSTVPVNVYKNKTPFVGKVVSTKRIVGPKATGETCHIVIDHKGGFPVSSM